LEGAYWQQGGSFSLKELSDIDDTASLLQFVQRTSDDFLVEFILSRLSGPTTGSTYREHFQVSAGYIPNQQLRGPPLL